MWPTRPSRDKASRSLNTHFPFVEFRHFAGPAAHFGAKNKKAEKFCKRTFDQEHKLEPRPVRGCPAPSKKKCVKLPRRAQMKSTPAKPSIVFCHGLWADGSCLAS